MPAMVERIPVIAIVGSADPRRTDELGLRDVELAPGACEALGRELAEQRARIIVYSSAADFIEASVVRGYAGSGRAQPASIEMRWPHGTGHGRFEGIDEQLLDPRPDSSPDWEVSFYRSLVETDGVLLVGGGRSTYVTGLIALAFGIPVVAIASFGGFAERVWQALDRAGNEAEPDEVSKMAREWNDALAQPLVASLLAQGQRRADKREQASRDADRESRRSSLALLLGLLFAVLAFAGVALGQSWDPGKAGTAALLIGAPLLDAAAGAIVRNALDRGHDRLRTAVLGMTAGGITALLFIAAQFATTPGLLESDDAPRLLFFVVPVGFIAGLTFDDVYRKLRSQDVARTDVLEP